MTERHVLSYTQARLIVWNAASYPKRRVREAAIYILGSIRARQEDIDQATSLV